jgi:hypothetical protein
MSDTEWAIVRWFESHAWIGAAAFAVITVVQVVQLILWAASR